MPALPFAALFPNAQPAWPLVTFAAVVLVAALASLGWGLTHPLRRPMLAGCGVLAGSLVAVLASLLLLYGLNLSGNAGR